MRTVLGFNANQRLGLVAIVTKPSNLITFINYLVSPKVSNMFSLYVLVLIVNAKISWSFMYLPSDDSNKPLQQNLQEVKNVGEPLILTPYLKSKKISKALELSSVRSFLNDKMLVSNAGFFTVDEQYNSNLFFWFFRKTSSDWQKAPLLLWLQGGPGCSSMHGLFEENGPFIVTEDGLKRRDYSWTNAYNMIYIDNPVGSGFSFTDSPKGYINTQEEVADHLYAALTQFFQLFPELETNAFYITGESYAGRYIPAISYKIHTLKKDNLTSINLKGLFMISASTEGLYNGWANFCHAIGIIDSQTKIFLETLEQKLKSDISLKQWEQASSVRGDLIIKVHTDSGVSLYDYTKPAVNIIKDLKFPSFLNEANTRKEIHVGNVEYFTCNDKIYEDFFGDISKSVVSWVEELVNYYPVAFVGGQFDVIVAYPLVLSVMEKLNWNGASAYKTATRKILGDKTLDGYIKSAGNLKDGFIRNAGHMVPKDQPQATFNLLNKFVNNEL